MRSQRNAVAVGMFDGVHLGHSRVLDAAQAHAERLGGDFTVLTFDPHPRAVITGQPPRLLCTLDERIERLRAVGAAHVEVVHFDDALRSMEPESFVDSWLVERLDAGAVVVGSGFRFGNGGRGDVDLLRSRGIAEGFIVEAVELAEIEGLPASSTRIRGALEAGDVALAAHMLGRPWAVGGVVVHGAKRGRELGFPTANLALASGLQVPGPGVYAGTGTALGGQTWTAAISVGNNPQFTPESHERTIEAFLLDYEHGEALYDERLDLTFVHRIRGQGVWPTIDGLIEQMHRDVARVRELAAT